MNLLLLSRGLGAVAPFLSRSASAAARAGGSPTPRSLRLAYVADAAAPYPGAAFAKAELAGVQALGYDVLVLHARNMSASEFEAALDGVDALYVAGGSTFALLESLRMGGAAEVIANKVRAGLAYIGSSAGSIVAGSSIEPASLMDDPGDAPELQDCAGMRLWDGVVIPHADGQLPPYPVELIQRTLQRFGADFHLVPLGDEQALLIDSDGTRIIDSTL